MFPKRDLIMFAWIRSLMVMLCHWCFVVKILMSCNTQMATSSIAHYIIVYL